MTPPVPELVVRRRYHPLPLLALAALLLLVGLAVWWKHPFSVPAPAPDLPKERWSRHDLTMLNGCWSLGHDRPSGYYEGGQRKRDGILKAKVICIDNNGHADVTSDANYGDLELKCKGAGIAAFKSDNHLEIRIPDLPCEHSTAIAFSENLDCSLREDGDAECTDQSHHDLKDPDGNPEAERHTPELFRRAAAR